MGVSNLSIGRTKLQNSLKNLKLKWEVVASQWNDDVRRHFEEEFLVGIDPKIQNVVQGIDQLLQVLAKAESECS